MKEHPTHKGYFVTEDGRVFSAWNNRGKLFQRPLKELSQFKHQNGYFRVKLREDKKYFVHRLVAETFIHNPDNLPFVNHKDEIKTNNNVNNLEWCDHHYNMEYSLAKTYIIENIKSQEIIEVYNMKRWCEERNLFDGALIGTYTRNHKIKSHKGYRVLSIKKER